MLRMKLDLKSTLECGQIFRFEETADGYAVFSKDKRALCVQTGEMAEIYTDDEDYFYYFFDGGRDYEKIQRALCEKDEIMRKIVPLYPGLRILNQDIWETTVSFLISQNNFIPRIRKIVAILCNLFGEEKNDFFAFPTYERLAQLKTEDLNALKCGYRDAYIIDAARRFLEETIDLNAVFKGKIEDARKELLRIKGVGPKVADCILLFGAGRREVFPTDTWIKKTVSQIYKIESTTAQAVNTWAKNRFGEHAGYAQQYLFYAAREKII